ncbi:MAG: hypothetical protein ACE5I3_10790 [Phycisphaerae bacterium]
MNFARHLIALTLTLAAALSAAGQTERKVTVDPASWVPSDALAYVGVADIEKLSHEFQRTAFYKLMQDPNAKESWGRVSLLSKFYEEFKNRLAKSLDTEPDKLKNPFGGPMALYVTPPRADPADEPGVVLVAGIGDAALMKGYYEQATRKFRELADNHEKVSFASYTIDQFTTEARGEGAEDEDPNDEDFDEFDLGAFDADDESFAAALDKLFGQLFSSDAMPEELVLCLTEDRLIAAPTPAHVKAVLRRERAGNSLVETEAYKTLLREFKPLGALRLAINLPRLFDMMAAVEGDEAEEALAMLGAKGTGSLIGHALFGSKDFESKLELLLLLSGERTGLAKVFSMKNRAVAPPAAVSADSVIYASVNANLTETLDEVERMVRRADPEAADQMRSSMETVELPDGETLNLRKEVLEKLREPLTFTMAFVRPYGPQSTRLRLTLGHRDKEAMARFLDKLSSLSPGMMLERELRGTLLYDIPSVGFSVAPTDNAIIAGTTDAVDAALQMPVPEESLAAEPEFKRAAALAPREAWGVLYVDSRRMFEAALEMVKNKDALVAARFMNPASFIPLRIVEAFTAGVGEDQIDATRHLSKYQAPSIVTVATTPDGIRMTQIQLVPSDK